MSEEQTHKPAQQSDLIVAGPPVRANVREAVMCVSAALLLLIALIYDLTGGSQMLPIWIEIFVVAVAVATLFGIAGILIRNGRQCQVVFEPEHERLRFLHSFTPKGVFRLFPEARREVFLDEVTHVKVSQSNHGLDGRIVIIVKDGRSTLPVSAPNAEALLAALEPFRTRLTTRQRWIRAVGMLAAIFGLVAAVVGIFVIVVILVY